MEGDLAHGTTQKCSTEAPSIEEVEWEHGTACQLDADPMARM